MNGFVQVKGILYEQEVVDASAIILMDLGMNKEVFNRNTGLIEFSRRLKEEFPTLSVTDRLHYFWAFVGSEEHGGPHFDIETGEKLGH